MTIILSISACNIIIYGAILNGISVFSGFDAKLQAAGSFNEIFEVVCSKSSI
jgi:hypothetical protein